METHERHAILMTAYKSAGQILDVINYLGRDFVFYIHVDKKSAMDLSLIGDIENVQIFKHFKVNWGSVNHLKSILFLSKEVLADRKNGYFHLITGQDFPAKSPAYFLNQLDTSKDYLEHFEMPAAHWLDGGGMNRLEYYNPYEVFDYRTILGKVLIKSVVTSQKMLGIKRRIPYGVFRKLNGGSTYWSLTRKSLQYVVDFTKVNRLAMVGMRFTFAAEEIYFQTVLMNSEYAGKIVNDNLRYVDWSPDRDGNPAILDNSDYDKIRSSRKIFARKFHEHRSRELKEALIKIQ
jgi:hypothetical protein